MTSLLLPSKDDLSKEMSISRKYFTFMVWGFIRNIKQIDRFEERIIFLIMNFLAFNKSFIHFDIYYKPFEAYIINDGFGFKRNEEMPIASQIGYFKYDNRRYGYGRERPETVASAVPILLGSSIGCSQGIHQFVFKLTKSSKQQDGFIGFVKSSSINKCYKNISNIQSNETSDLPLPRINTDIFGYFLRLGDNYEYVLSKLVLYHVENFRIDNWGDNLLNVADSLTITLDCNKWKLSFKSNDSGNKHISIDADNKYHLVFCDRSKESHVKLISYNYC